MTMTWRRAAGWLAWGISVNVFAWLLGVDLTWQAIVLVATMGVVGKIIDEVTA